MDRIVVMRSFVGVGDEGSFSQAARHLGISVSLVSRHVADLEKHLDIRLLNRTARAVSLTAAGHRYHDFAHRILDEIDREESSIRGLRERTEGPLAVVCPRWIGNLDLAEAIADFSVDHPKIIVRFEVGGMSERTFDFLDRGYDIAFHTNDLRDSTMLIRKMAELDFVLCASPTYLRTAPPLHDPQQIPELDCLVHIHDQLWDLTDSSGAETHVKVPSAVYSSNSHLTLLKAAVRGRGIALLPVRTATADLAAGNLVRVLPEFRGPTRSLYAVHSPGSHTLRKVQVFLDYVAAWFIDHPVDREHDAMPARM